MLFTKLYLLPGLVIVAVLGTFLISYGIAVHLKHIRAFFPYISDTGTTPPESTIFGQFLNLGSIFIFLTMYVRYLYIKKTYLGDPNSPNHASVKRYNHISILLALFVSLGASVVANFQETVAFVPHILGASACYFGGTCYFILQTVISYMVCPQLNTLTMARFRLILSVLSTFLTIICGLFGVISYFLFTKSIKDIPMWAPGEGGYELHVVSSIVEWLVTIVFAVYFVTFIKEFKNIVITSPQVELSQPNNYSFNSCTISTVDRTNKKTAEDNNKNFAPDRIASSNVVHPA